MHPLLQNEHKKWLVTGVAGFIGSHLLEELLRSGQDVIGLDNFQTGHQKNLDQVREIVGEDSWRRFRFVKGDILNEDSALVELLKGVDFVLHHAALGSVPSSMQNPQLTYSNNVDGFVKVIEASRKAKVGKFIYASSSSVYGDSQILPAKEGTEGQTLSPYGASKKINEIIALNYSKAFGMNTIGFRYFNVFGSRQDPNGPYAAVIPRWINAIQNKSEIVIFGDGSSTRDYCHVANIVEANIRAAISTDLHSSNQVYNVALGTRTTLNELFKMLQNVFAQSHNIQALEPKYEDFRQGDINHSYADIQLIEQNLEFKTVVDVHQGLEKTVDEYLKDAAIVRR